MDRQQVPKTEFLLTLLDMYKTSVTTKNLKSERNRTVFADDFETKQVPLLSTLCLEVVAKNYKGRPINLNLTPRQWNILFDFIDPYLPIPMCINILDEYYWKKVFCLMCTDKIAIKEKTKDKNTCWKELVINMKYVEILESTPVEIWILEEMHKLSKLVAPYIGELKISKLQPMRESSFKRAMQLAESSEESLGGNEEEQMVEEEEEEEEEMTDEERYPIELCHHGDLSIVKNLYNMHTLIIEFVPPELGIHYHTRFFDFSYVDMQNLASGISELPNLRSFCIRRSRMDSVKLSTILEAVKTIFLEHLEFYYCQLDDDCGESLYEFLVITSCLKNLNLSGNHFRDSVIEYLAEGIQNSPSSLTHLGLSNNPITDTAICKLTEALKVCKELTYFTLSGVKVTKPGSICIAEVIKTLETLEEVELIAVPMEGYYIIAAVEENKNIQQLLCQGCGLTLEEEFKVELLLRRNRYIRQNPYIGDETKTEEEINAYVSRIKNPILLKALEIYQNQIDCEKKKQERTAEQDAIYIPEEKDDASETSDIQYEAGKFTRAELLHRISLFPQSDSNFFKK